MATHTLTLCYDTKDNELTVYKEILVGAKEPLTGEDIGRLESYIRKMFKEKYDNPTQTETSTGDSGMFERDCIPSI